MLDLSGKQINPGDVVHIYLGTHPILGGDVVGGIVTVDDVGVYLDNLCWIPIKHIKTIVIQGDVAA